MSSTDGYPVLDGHGKIVVERRVPHGAVDHGQNRADMMAMVLGHHDKMNALGELPLMDEEETFKPSLWNRFVGIFKPRSAT